MSFDRRAYDHQTGRFVETCDPQDAIGELEHERAMRDLGAEPELYPDELDGDLADRIRFHQVHRDADIADGNRAAEDEAAFATIVFNYEEDERAAAD